MLIRIQSARNRGLAAFAVTVVFAVLMRWEGGDLMWGIWASATTYGLVYGTMLIMCNPKEVGAGDGTDKGPVLGVLMGFILIFGVFHYAEGIFLSMIFPITSLEGWALFGYPAKAFSWYWGIIATTFYSRWPELVSATEPSEDLHRLLAPFKSVAVMHVMVFLFMFMSAAGLIRYAAYPVLLLYFFPATILREKAMFLLGKWEDYMDPVLRQQSNEQETLNELLEIEESDDSGR